MRIKRARIQNFRCIEDVDIDFESVTTFIGPNGAGKSTVLRALYWFFNGGELSDDDLFHGAARRWIQVEVEFDALTAVDRQELGSRYAPESADTVTIWKTWDNGAEKMTGKALAYADFEEIRNSTEGAVVKRNLYNELQGGRPDLDLPLPGGRRWDDVEQAMSDWERAHPEHLTSAAGSDTHFFGFVGGAKMSGLFDFVLVTADLRAAEEAQDSKSSVVGRILERAVNRSAADAALEELTARYQRQREEIHGTHYGTQLEALSRELTKAVKAFTRGRSVKISPGNADPKPQRVQFTVSIMDHEAETSIDRQGHGFQRALLIAALKMLADRGSVSGQQGVICLAIEEPELFQHPVQARAFATVLRRLAGNMQQQIQVTYATHSPFFLEAAHFPQVRRVSRRLREGAAIPTVEITHVTQQKVILRLKEYQNDETKIYKSMPAVCTERLAEALFADAVVLVEGTTDKGILEGCAELDGTPLAVDGVTVVPVGGKNNLPLPHAILTELGIRCYVIFDGDKGATAGKPGTSKDANKNIKENRALLAYLGVQGEDWPGTGVYGTYAVFGDNLETELVATWPSWNDKRNELVNSGWGFAEKNEITYRRAAAEAEDKMPDVFQEIISAIRAM